MKLVTYRTDHTPPRPGFLLDGVVVDAASAASRVGRPEAIVGPSSSNRDLIALGPERLTELASAARGPGVESRELTDVRLGPPIPDPQKIICLGLNYSDHAAESGLTPRRRRCSSRSSPTR
jgi:2-keto-4-pentenoate hydratase/2-oxohepta-3-ene-1,7-dioic acid hydratase in catechol pathway